MYTLEELIEQIKEPKSKKLFTEIFSIYNQGIYRPVVVMLWTVVVCDIIYKLQYLKYIYNDKTAIEILDTISKLQEKKKYSSEWEKKLLERIRDNTELLTNIEYDSLEYIQKQRNLCAHPIITDDSLFNPSKDLTRNLLRSALECILTKHPILSKNFIDLITDDLYERRDDFTFDDEATVKYVESKYLTKLTIVQKMKLFKALWKFAFISSGEKENATRDKNVIILNHLLNKFKENCVTEIIENSDSYTYDNRNGDVSNSFYNFIIKNQYLYKILSEHTKLIIKEECKNFPKVIPCVFLNNNFLEHMKSLNVALTASFYITREIEYLQIMTLYELSKEYNETKLFFDFCISFFCKSCSYKMANKLFPILIYPYYKYYDFETLKKLINESSYNKQICERERAEIEHRCIANQFVNIGGTLDDIENHQSSWDIFISDIIKEKECNNA